MKKQITFLLITVLAGLVLVTTAFAQNQIGVQTKSFFNSVSTPAFGTTQNFLPVSPQAGSLGIFGQIPVGNYTGTAEISIPLYEIKYKELSVPIGISYHASGVKPDVFSGTVGLGWTLQAGGMISRVINGDPDFGELLPSESPIIPMTPEDPRKEVDWASTAQIERPLKDALTYDPKSDPDEYYFNINGKTGRFYMQYDGTFIVQSLDGGTFQITANTGLLSGGFLPLEQTRVPDAGTTSHTYNNQITMYDALKGFTMIDENGIKYSFGGSLNTIEFSRPGFNEYSSDAFKFFSAFVQPMSWYLTSIESPNGYKIDFTYKQQTIITKVRFCDVAVVDMNNSTHMCVGYTFPDSEKSTLINGCYLTRISFPTGYVDFANSMACDQLDYLYQGNDNYDISKFNKFQYYDDVHWANTEKVVDPNYDSNPEKVRNRFFPYRLDKVTVYNNDSKLIRYFSFGYTGNRNTRLKLTSLTVGGENDDDLLNSHKNSYSYYFDYNSTQLPPYLSNKTDYYGYYNGRLLFNEATISDRNNNYYLFMRNHPGYLDTAKMPDFTYGQAEILQKVTYPTKGYSVFEYESHDYGCSAEIWPFGINNNPNGTLPSGGVRIKSVKSYDKGGSILQEKRYHYTKNYLSGGTLSSGVLAYKPQYEERYNNVYIQYGGPGKAAPALIKEYLRFSTNPIYPMSSTRGNHVTYSEVTVEEVGNGYTVYKYKNFDNGYNDIAPLNQASNALTTDWGGLLKIDLWKKEEGQSLKLERGQILSEEVYTQSKKLQKKVLYTYDTSNARFDEGVRYLRLTPNSVNMLDRYRSHRISAGLHFTYFPCLKEKTVIDYANKPIEVKEVYAYTSQYRLPKSVTAIDSQGKILESRFVYPFERTTTSDIFQAMTTKHMYNYPVESSKIIDGKMISKEMWEYTSGLAPDAPSLILPHKRLMQYLGSPVYIEATINRYDSDASPQSIEYLSGDKLVLLWADKGTSVAAKIDGLSYQEVSEALGESFIKNIYTESPYFWYSCYSDLKKIKGSEVSVTTYDSVPLIGVAAETDSTGKTTYYSYDSLGRLTESYFMENGQKKIIKSYSYHYETY